MFGYERDETSESGVALIRKGGTEGVEEVEDDESDMCKTEV